MAKLEDEMLWWKKKHYKQAAQSGETVEKNTLKPAFQSYENHPITSLLQRACEGMILKMTQNTS